MQESLQKLGERRLLLVTGKGGSGKSVLACALAIYFAKQGKKVNLVEIGRKRDRSFSRLHELLGINALRHEKQNIAIGATKFTASVLDPTRSLSEYVDLKLPTAGLASILLNNKVTASLLEIVPGLPELVSLGKLWYSLAMDKNGPDMVIIDGPASGHAVTLVHAPQNFEKLTKQGPLHRDAEAMRLFLENEKKSAILFTSLPEEMSLQESLEHQEILKNFSLPLIFLNKIFPSPAPRTNEHENAKLLHAYEYSFTRAKREKEAIKQFRKEKWQNVEIPFFFPEQKLLVERVADWLETL